MKDLLSNVGAGGGAPAVGAPAAGGGGGGAAAAAEAPAEEKKEEEKEESDDDMVSIPLGVSARDAYQNVRALVSSTDLWSRIIHSHRLLLAFHTNALYFSLHKTHLK